MKAKRFAFCTFGEKETERAGEILAGIVRGVICLDGDLGSGKTVLARGVARGLGITEYITSPTFNIVNVYENADIVFNHMDAYRMTDPEMLYDIGFYEMIDSGRVTVIEWADMIKETMGGCSVSIRMQRGSTDDRRIIELESEPDVIAEFIRRWQ